MLKSFKMLEKIIDIKAYDKIINLYFKEFEMYGIDLEKYTKEVKVGEEKFNVKIVINPNLNNKDLIYIFLESKNILANIKLVNNSQGYNKSLIIFNNNKSPKLYDFKKIIFTETIKGEHANVSFYCYNKKEDSSDFNIHKDIYIQFEKNKNIKGEKSLKSSDYSSVSVGEDRLLIFKGTKSQDINDFNELIEKFLISKDNSVFDNYIPKSKNNIDYRTSFKRNIEEDTRQIEYSLNLLKNNNALKKFIISAFDTDTYNNLFNSKKYIYNSSKFVNISNPNIVFNPNIFVGNENSFKFQIENDHKHYLIMKNRIAIHAERLKIEDVCSLNFDFIDIINDKLHYTVPNQGYHNIKIFSDEGEDSNKKYCELINKIIKQMELTPANLKEIVYSEDHKIKEQLELINLSSDKDYIYEMQKPFNKIKKELLINDIKTIKLKKKI